MRGKEKVDLSELALVADLRKRNRAREVYGVMQLPCGLTLNHSHSRAPQRRTRVGDPAR